MIIHNDTKKQFVEDVRCNVIADKILKLVRERGINAERVAQLPENPYSPSTF